MWRERQLKLVAGSLGMRILLLVLVALIIGLSLGSAQRAQGYVSSKHSIPSSQLGLHDDLGESFRGAVTDQLVETTLRQTTIRNGSSGRQFLSLPFQILVALEMILLRSHHSNYWCLKRDFGCLPRI